MNFKITGLPSAPFQPYFSMDEATLKSHGAMRVYADEDAAPCRVSLVDAVPGEELLLVAYEHQSAQSPYRAAGPIFVRKNALEANLAINIVPEQIRSRLLSVRAYDRNHHIVEAEVSKGALVEKIMDQFFQNDAVAYIHLHFARRGCYAARVDRA